MAFGGDVDTLNLLFDKLQYIFSGYNPIRDSFLEMNNLYKQGKISERDFFEKLHESINRFSALEFLLIKTAFEIKKTLDKSSGRSSSKHEIPSVNLPPPSNSLASFITAKNLPRSDVYALYQGAGNVCSRCSVIMNRLSKFCTNCGSKLQ
ncbi:MAG: hypothetical protein ACREA3_01670 [Nitrosotalea sp.]